MVYGRAKGRILSDTRRPRRASSDDDSDAGVDGRVKAKRSGGPRVSQKFGEILAEGVPVYDGVGCKCVLISSLLSVQSGLS